MDLTMNTIDIVVSDMDAAVAFYRRLGLEFTVDASYPDHADCALPGGLQLMLDTEKFRGPTVDGWTPPSGGPGRSSPSRRRARRTWTPCTPR
ncbi:hypothetical protein LUW74_43490 [Actinomadura madurae]|uniref:VOC family protein n=1 Tax=Actinomadura madurae TaxID=1993 RepID=UPI00202745D4|nr:VOC family protein [Actinomadura madurae]URN09543.1 hypothetical protein LUW74_43490 [Actinomadura madurae]